MILPNNTSVLRNIKDSFYYNGIEISKNHIVIGVSYTAQSEIYLLYVK